MRQWRGSLKVSAESPVSAVNTDSVVSAESAVSAQRSRYVHVPS